MKEMRARKVADQIRQTLSEIVLRELRDPGIGFVTLTAVQLSPDLRHARVFVSMLGDEDEGQASLAALRKAAPYIRRVLGERVRLRHVPELRFVEDVTEKRAGRIEELIREVRDQRRQGDDS